jgi:xylulokinase
VQQIAPQIFGLPIGIPEPGEYVADGAARQAAWTLAAAGDPGAVAPAWSTTIATTLDADPKPVVREQYAAVRDLV